MRAAGKRIWDYLITSKLYLTGGIGASGSGEAFGQPYELPNMTAYNETCASVGMDFWNHRLFLLEGDAKYIDVMERTLYNGLLSGVSLDGKTFFYPNPLESNGQHARQEWFGVACCPGNITRFMPSVPGYLYATRGDSLLREPVCARARRRSICPAARSRSTQDTRYPWDGAVKMTVTPATRATLRDQRAHSRLGAQRAGAERPLSLHSTNRRAAADDCASTAAPVPMTLDKGYVDDRSHAGRPATSIDAQPADAGPPRRLERQVMANRDRVALQRGPIVFAAEWPDNPNGKVRNIVLPDGNALTTEFRRDLLNGVQVITRARGRPGARRERARCSAAEQPFMAIPYATWANRGRGQMAVWLARVDAAARPTPFPTVVTHRHDRGVAAAERPRQEPAQHHRRRRAGELVRLVGLLRLVAGAGQRERVGRADVREAVDRVDEPRSTGSTTPAAAACACRRRGGCSTSPAIAGCRSRRTSAYGVARNAWNAIAFTPVTTAGAPHRAGDAAGILRGPAGMEIKVKSRSVCMPLYLGLRLRARRA